MAETHSGTARSGCPPLRAATSGAALHSPTLKDPRISGPQKRCAFTLHQLQYCVHTKGERRTGEELYSGARKSFIKTALGGIIQLLSRPAAAPWAPARSAPAAGSTPGRVFALAFSPPPPPLPTPGYSSPARSKQAVPEPAASRPGP